MEIDLQISAEELEKAHTPLPHIKTHSHKRGKRICLGGTQSHEEKVLIMSLEKSPKPRLFLAAPEDNLF